MKRWKNQFSPSMIVSLIALFVALSGVAVAGVTLSNNTVRSNNIVNGQVKNADLATNSVGKLKIKSGAIDSSKIVDGAVADADIAGVAGAKVTGTVANADKLDNLDSTAFQRRVRWAVVDSTGTILSQTGGISVTATTGIGGYYLNFGEPVTDKGIIATLKYDVSSGTRGEILAAPCGAVASAQAVACTAADTGNPNHLWVLTSPSDGGTSTVHDFYVAVIS